MGKRIRSSIVNQRIKAFNNHEPFSARKIDGVTYSFVPKDWYRTVKLFMPKLAENKQDGA